MGCTTSAISDQPYKLTIKPSSLNIRSKRHVIINQKMFPMSNVLSECVEKSIQNLTEYDQEILKYFLRHHYLFSGLKENQREYIAEKFQCYQGKVGTYPIKKGDLGALFFYIESGAVQVELPDKQTVKLCKGQSFGQLALLYKAPRSASIKCLQNCLFFCLHQTIFRSALQKLAKRQFQISKLAIQQIHLFNFLTNKQKAKLAHNMYILHFQKGDTIFNTGDDANAFYIIGVGKVEIEVPLKPKIQLKTGQSFGQSCFKDFQKRNGTAICLQKTDIFSLSRNTMTKCLGNQLTQLYFFSVMRWALKRVSIFKGISLNMFDRIISESKVKKLKGGQYICKEGDPFLFLVVCLEGQINGMGVGTLFNAQYLFQEKNQPKIIRSIIKYDEGNVCIIQVKRLKSILGNAFHQIIEKFPIKKQKVDDLQKQKEMVKQLELKDFNVVRKIGYGQFGQVFQVQDIYRNKSALKSVSKSTIVQFQMHQFILNQKNILNKMQSPFIVRFFKTFKDQNNFFFLMNLLQGKDFLSILLQIGLCDHKKSKFYIGCAILALQYLHSKNIVYRDLKSQNCVLDKNGYINLVDMGTARQLKVQNGYKTYTVIGTPHYMAPQIVQGKGYSFSADLWSLGILLYQFVCGKFPYGQKLTDPYQIFRSITQSDHIQFPNFYNSKQGRQLISILLNKDQLQRQQFETQDFGLIKSHAFFKNFNWDFLAKKKISSPYKSKLTVQKQEEKININASKYFKTMNFNNQKIKEKSIFFDWEKQF